MISESWLVKLAKKMRASLEVFEESSQHTAFTANGTAVENREHVRSRGYGVRVLKGRRMGFAAFERESDVEDAVRMASRLAEKQEPADYYFAGKARARSQAFFDARVNQLSEADYMQRVESMRDRVIAMHATPIQTAFGTRVIQQSLWNTDGLSIQQKFSRFYAFSHCSQAGSEADDSFSSSRLSFSTDRVAANAASHAERMSGAKKMRGGTLPFVFDVRALESLFSLFLPFHFSGESFRKGLSHWKKGDGAFSESISLVDDPRLKEGENACVYDDEGVMAKRKTLVRKGRVQSFLFDGATAAKIGETAGNGYRSSFEAAPKPSWTHMTVEGGHLSNALDDVRDGVYVNSFLTSGANTVTGDFAFPLLVAFRIRNGEPTEGIKGAMFQGNVFEWLKQAAFEKKREYAHGVLSGKMRVIARIVA
ncbi:TldD/PmbA family protein [Candidatus Micrarchaeota archaeon]|nr:TldD/PmbA family protein [Candidatus Micrarchaeota archaeon]